MPFVLRSHRALALALLTLGLAAAGGTLGAFAFGLFGASTSIYSPSSFEAGSALFGLCITAPLSALLPHLAGKARQPDDELGAIVRAGGKLGVATLALALLLGFTLVMFTDGPLRFDSVVIALVLSVVGTVLGSFVAGPLGMAFGLVFAYPILRTWEAWRADDGRSAEGAALSVAGLLIVVAGLSQLAPDDAFRALTREILGAGAVLVLLLHLALRATRRRFIASLAAHPQLMCVSRELAEIAEGTTCLLPEPRSAVVARSLDEPYRGRPQALALV